MPNFNRNDVVSLTLNGDDTVSFSGKASYTITPSGGTTQYGNIDGAWQTLGPFGVVVTLSLNCETAGSYTVVNVGKIVKSAITSSRPTTTSDDQSIAGNNTSNNYTITVDANTVPNGMILQQLSTGTVTVAAGSGVTFIGSTLATSSAGQQIVITPTPVANTFNIKVA